MKQFTSIVLSGGSFWTISTLGALKRLSEEQSLDSIKNYVGTSAGAIISLCLVIGYSPQECLDFIIFEFLDKNAIKFNPLEAFNILDTFGLFQGGPIEDLIDRIFEKKKVSKSITFMELAKLTGKNLVICVSNVNKAISEFWCVDETPGMAVKFALRASCAIPLIITPIQYNENMYCDGCIYNNLPLSYFKANLLKDIFVIRVTDFTPYRNVTSVFQYFWRIIASMMYTITEMRIEQFNHDDNNIMTMSIHCDDMFEIISTDESIELGVHKDKLNKLFQEGYSQANAEFSKQKRQQLELALQISSGLPDYSGRHENP